jgi:hypothetical protein
MSAAIESGIYYGHNILRLCGVFQCELSVLDLCYEKVKALLGASKEVGLEVNPEKTKYMLVSRCQKAGQRQSIKTASRSFEDMAKFKYLGITRTDQNCILEEIKSRQNSGNACSHSVQSLLSSRLLSKNVKVKIYKTIIMLVVLYGCETWFLTLREEHRLGVFENRFLRRIFGRKRDEVMGNGGICTMRKFIICTHPQISLGWLEGTVHWIRLAQDRDRWRAVVSAVMNL